VGIHGGIIEATEYVQKGEDADLDSGIIVAPVALRRWNFWPQNGGKSSTWMQPTGLFSLLAATLPTICRPSGSKIPSRGRLELICLSF